MKIIVEIATDEVLFVGDSFAFTGEGLLHQGTRHPWCTSDIFEVLDVNTVPDDFRGRHYTYTEAGGWVRTALGEEALADRMAAAQEDLKAECIKAVSDLIQSKVDAYNRDHGTILGDIRSCKDYIDEDPAIYDEQPFCAAVWAWNVQVWIAAKQILAQAMAGEITITSPAEALALLPEFTFEG